MNCTRLYAHEPHEYHSPGVERKVTCAGLGRLGSLMAHLRWMARRDR